MQFHKLGLAVALSVCAPLTMAVGTPVPVTDTGVKSSLSTLSTSTQKGFAKLGMELKESGSNEAKAIVRAIELLAKQMSQQNDASTMQIHNALKSQKDLEAKERNANLYNPSLGVKPRTACGVLSGARAIKAGDQEVRKINYAMNQAVKEHSRRGIYDEQGEASPAVDADRILRDQVRNEVRDEQTNGQAVAAGYVPTQRGALFSDASLKVAQGLQGEHTALLARLSNLANPFPLKLAAGYNDPNQPEMTKTDNAANSIHLQRQDVIGEIFSRYVSRRTATYDKSFSAALGVNKDAGIDVTSGLPDHVGRMEIDTLLNTHRVTNDSWVGWINGANEVGALRDGVQIQAQMLATLDRIDKSLEFNNILQALIYAHRLEQSGPPVPTAAHKLNITGGRDE